LVPDLDVAGRPWSRLEVLPPPPEVRGERFDEGFETGQLGRGQAHVAWVLRAARAGWPARRHVQLSGVGFQRQALDWIGEAVS